MLLVMSVMRMHAVGGGHGVYATRMPGMAAAQSPHSEPAAVEDTEALDRLACVIRTRRMKAARGTEQRAQGPLVQADQGYEQGAHWTLILSHNPSRLARSCAAEASFARGRALTTRSTSGSSCWRSLKDSRIRRRMRLRGTDPPNGFEATARPRRASPRSFGWTVIPKWLLPKRLPRAYS